MKKGRILNRQLNDALSILQHGDIVVISDAGFPASKNSMVIDLALQKDDPSIMKMLELFISDFIYEKVVVAEEQKMYNPVLFKGISDLCDRCPVTTIPHSQILEEYVDKAKVVIRTGAFEPWGNTILVSGIDAPVWFQKPGATYPDYYSDRVNYEEKDK